MADSNPENTSPSGLVDPENGLNLSDLLPVFPKVLAGLIAGGVLVFNVWFAGIFGGGHPLDSDNWKFFVLVYLQALFIGTAIGSVRRSLLYDVAGGVLAGTVFVIIGDLAGAFRGAFNLGSFLAQVFLAYTAAYFTILQAGRFKRRASR